MDGDGMAAVRALIEASAGASAGDRPVYLEGSTGRALSWVDLHAGVVGWDGIAAELGDGPRVGLVAADPLTTIASFLGALAAGVLVCPLDPGAAPTELATQAGRLGLAAVVADGEAEPATALMGVGRRWCAVPGGVTPVAPPAPAVAGPAAGPAITDQASEGVALLLGSSGTTGDPKIIPLTLRQLVATAAAVAEGHGLGPDAVGYSPLPLFHINGLVVGVLSTVLTGGRLVVDRRFSAGRFWATVAATGATWLNLVPAIITVLAERDAPPAGVTRSIRFARSASAPLPAAVRERFERRCQVGVIETYGMTEAASQIAANPFDPGRRRPGSVGLPVAVELQVVGREGCALAAGQVGEVHIRGPRVVARYWGPAPAGGSQPAVGPDGWLATGDLGWVDDDGYVFLVGRVDDVINRGGEKVFPREVEEVLLADADVSSAAVVGRPHPTVGEEPVAFVLAAAGVDPDGLAERLAARCAARLTRYKRPAEIVVADRLPAGPTGKIRHAELRRSVADGAPTTATCTP